MMGKSVGEVSGSPEAMLTVCSFTQGYIIRDVKTRQWYAQFHCVAVMNIYQCLGEL